MTDADRKDAFDLIQQLRRGAHAARRDHARRPDASRPPHHRDAVPTPDADPFDRR